MANQERQKRKENNNNDFDWLLASLEGRKPKSIPSKGPRRGYREYTYPRRSSFGVERTTQEEEEVNTDERKRIKRAERQGLICVILTIAITALLAILSH